MFSCCKNSAAIFAEPAPESSKKKMGSRPILHMDEEETTIIENTWNELKEGDKQNEFIEILFKEFFKLDPQAKELFLTFAQDIDEGLYNSYPFKHHCEIFAFHIGLAVKYMRDNLKLATFLSQLGKVHDNIFLIRENYGKEDKENHAKMNEHFAISEKALQMALKTHFGDKLTKPVSDAWAKFYLLQINMILNEVEICNRDPSPPVK